MYPNEGLGPKPQPSRLFVTIDPRPRLAVVEHGHDVLEHLMHMIVDTRTNFFLESIRGYAAEQRVTLTLPTASHSGQRVLLLTGWTDYAFSGDNVAAHQCGLKMVPPMLQVPDGNGGWGTVIENIGFPVGQPQTVPVDLNGRVPRNVTAVRLVTTMRVFGIRAVRVRLRLGLAILALEGAARPLHGRRRCSEAPD